MQQQFVRGSSVSYFNHWTRKSFAIFNSLNKVVKICSLSFAMLLVFSPDDAQGQKDSTGTEIMHYYLEETEVVAQRAIDVNGSLAKVVTIITKEEIAARPIQLIQIFIIKDQLILETLILYPKR